MSSILLSDKNVPAEVCQALKVLDKHFGYINRVEVIDSLGRTYVNLNVIDIGIGIQDDMGTLKLFLEDINS
tara:strand:- start:10706 stop:10918 length:213 start_codon:yes stop_codon:yes gene_type:complete